MKKIIFSAFLAIGLVNFAAAQKTRLKSSKTSLSSQKDTSIVSQANNLSQTNSYKAYPTKSEEFNNREIIHWKDGQKATTTGHEAAASNDESFISLTKK